MRSQTRKGTTGLLVSVAAVGAIASSCAQPQEIAGRQPGGALDKRFTFEYGPQNAAGISQGKNVKELFGQLGAPYATYPLGSATVYRWGHGLHTAETDGTASIRHDELLVTASSDGTIVGVSYKNKLQVSGPFSVLAAVPPP